MVNTNPPFSFFSKASSAFSVAIDAARRVWVDPTGADSHSNVGRSEYYNRYWAYYNNTAFDDMNQWEQYRSKFGLYRFHRSIYNPTKRLVDFYVNEIYPGVFYTDPTGLPEGQQLAMPFNSDIKPELKDAIQQLWQWNNFQDQQQLIVQYAAALGNTLVEIIDDPVGGKIRTKVWWPSFVTDIQLDAYGVGNVKGYVIEYMLYNPDGSAYRLTKEVTQKEFRYYKDDKPFNYTGSGAVVENPYGFAPAVWVRHNSIGEDFGQPVIAASLGKIEELNSLVSRAHDKLFSIMGAPIILSSGGGSGDLIDRNTPKATSEESPTSRDRIKFLKGPEGTKVDSLPLEVGPTLMWVNRLIEEIESEHRELSLYAELRSMSTLTGPAAERLMGDVAKTVGKVALRYDTQMEKLFQMSVAIGGYRSNLAPRLGGWGDKQTSQQLKFKPFGLSSYANDELVIRILPRKLIPMTNFDKWSSQKAMVDTQFIKKQLNVPPYQRFIEMGYTEEQAKEFEEYDKQQTALAQSLIASKAGNVPNTSIAPNTTKKSNSGNPVPNRAATGNAEQPSQDSNQAVQNTSRTVKRPVSRNK